jgi:poly-gamma-glutamate capsule biosynthesis protein CapA/YwtB (metallophosphatase superfamily)
MRSLPLLFFLAIAIPMSTFSQEAAAPEAKKSRPEPRDVSWVPDPLSQIPSSPDPATVKNGFTFVAVGDLLYGRPAMAQNNPDLETILKLLRSGDLAFANLEGTLFDRTTHPLPPREGELLVGLPEVADDIKAMGFGIVSKANNHSDDWGREGLRENLTLLKKAGVPYAGAGDSRSSARQATFVDTPHGRVAIVASASTFSPNAAAEDQVGDIPPRSGISTLRTTKIYRVTPEEMAQLRTLAARYNCTLCRPIANDQKQITLGGDIYRVSDKPGLTYEMNPFDEFELLRSVRGGKQEADLVVFSIHAHEGSLGVDDNNYNPGDFLPVLFHHTIDAGADIVVAHGPHALRGVEIYKGKPIFYGLGTFIFQGLTEAGQDTLERLKVDPRFGTHADYRLRNFNNPDIWNQGLLTTTMFENGKVKEVRLYPIDTSASENSPRLKGIPRFASPEVAQRALDRVRRASEQFGTDIKIENNVGVIRINN